MRKLAAVLPLFLATCVLAELPLDAKAGHLGVSVNPGRGYSVPGRSAAVPRRSADASSTRPVPSRRGTPRRQDPLAGGWFASLMSGAALKGMRLMGIVIPAAALIGLFLLIRSRRSRVPPVPLQGSFQRRTAGGSSLGDDEISPLPGQGRAATAINEPACNEPAWFDAEDFLEDARALFIRLQAERGDSKDNPTYTTPEMLVGLASAHDGAGDAQHDREVAYLDAVLIGLQRDGENVVASVRFFGGICEARSGITREFSEIWHLVHPWETVDGNWSLAGIQQY